MESENKKPPLEHHNYIENIHKELEKDIKHGQDEIKTLLEKKDFYNEILQNVSAIFFVINLSRKKITWYNETYRKIMNGAGLRNEEIIKQVLPHYDQSDDGLDGADVELEAQGHDDKKSGAIKIENTKGKKKGKITSYYFQSYTLKYDKYNNPYNKE